MRDGAARLLADASEWRLLGLLLECPSAMWRSQVSLLANQVGESQLRTIAETALAQASEASYYTVTGPGGPFPMREVSYRDALTSGQLLGELGAYFRAFGYAPETAEPPDHLAVEAGFVAYLRMKEAYALSCGEQDHAEVAAKASQSFIADHLQPVAEFMVRARLTSSDDYLAQTVSALCRRVGVSIEPVK